MPSPEPLAGAEPKPLTTEGGTILVGTLETLTALGRQIEAIPGCPVPVGCVVIGAAGVGAIAGPDPARPLAVLGSVGDLGRLREKLRLRSAVVCLPSSMPTVIASTREAVARAGLEERFVAPLGDLLARGGDPATCWRPGAHRIDPAALIGREAHTLDRASVSRVLRGRRVLITGAGGSIGSELARIVAGFDPELLVLMDRSENALFDIDRRIGERTPGVARRAVLHDVVESEGTMRLVAQHRPQVIFHAAAHKHVPLMEDHPAHAVTNNVFGTRAIADAAYACGTERFVLISTDKAVRPTSVMGATKRIAEQYARWMHARGRRGAGEPSTTYSVVRFGNVLGSACSVLPIWAAQLADGGPITVTDPRMTRYFMTIPEAATLVTQAAALSGETRTTGQAEAALFVLDMGAPLRILDLAERFVRLHGIEPVIRRDGAIPMCAPAGVEIVFTGIRPGEKLEEELSYAGERLLPTRHPGIRALEASDDPLPDVSRSITSLDRARSSADAEEILDALRSCLPEFGSVRFAKAG